MAHAATHTLGRFVDRLLIRSLLSPEERGAILALPCDEVRVGKRLDIVPMNKGVTWSSFVVSGMVARFGQTMDGKRQVTALHLPGDVADLDAAVRPIGIGGLNAICESVILRVPHGAIRALAARHPAIAEAFWRDCLVDAAVSMQWVINVGRRNAATRLAHLFCELAVRSGSDRAAVPTFDMPMVQEQLGDAAALTPVHVNRTLKLLGELVTFKEGRVTIHDWGKLVRLGEFDATYLTADVRPDARKRLLAIP